MGKRADGTWGNVVVDAPVILPASDSEEEEEDIKPTGPPSNLVAARAAQFHAAQIQIQKASPARATLPPSISKKKPPPPPAEKTSPAPPPYAPAFPPRRTTAIPHDNDDAEPAELDQVAPFEHKPIRPRVISGSNSLPTLRRRPPAAPVAFSTEEHLEEDTVDVEPTGIRRPPPPIPRIKSLPSLAPSETLPVHSRPPLPSRHLSQSTPPLPSRQPQAAPPPLPSRQPSPSAPPLPSRQPQSTLHSHLDSHNPHLHSHLDPHLPHLRSRLDPLHHLSTRRSPSLAHPLPPAAIPTFAPLPPAPSPPPATEEPQPRAGPPTKLGSRRARPSSSPETGGTVSTRRLHASPVPLLHLVAKETKAFRSPTPPSQRPSSSVPPTRTTWPRPSPPAARFLPSPRRYCHTTCSGKTGTSYGTISTRRRGSR
ncbi:hypothetical protein K438DRAFT_1255522 [Mycena galopus ATCC 62051]|nr:hypothetical protein K438DRAFT_1255522 [Mycena galopus ATCC 62051]